MIRKIGEAIELLASNLALFGSIMLTVWLPASILLVYLRLYVFPEAVGGDEVQLFMRELRISNAIDLAFGALYTGALLYAASRLKQGLNVTYGEAMAHAARRSFKLLGARIITGAIVFVGLIALIVPGIVLALRFALIDSVVVLESVEGGPARALSAELTRGKRWTILGTMIFAFFGVLLTIFLTSLALYLPLISVGQDENFIIAVIDECVSSIILIVPTIVLFLFYWDVKQQRQADIDTSN